MIGIKQESKFEAHNLSQRFTDKLSVPTINEPPPYEPVPSSLSLQLPLHHTRRAPSPTPSALSAQSIQSQMGEDPYSFLSTFDTVLLIDDSGSMHGRSWKEVKAALSTLLPVVCSHDKDGIDVYFLNEKSSDIGDERNGTAGTGYRNISSVKAVERLFKSVSPGGGTPTGTRLRALLKPYLSHLEAQDKRGKIDEVKPLNILVLTDGVPSDDVETVIINAAKKLDALDAAPHQVGIQFFQVGNEPGAGAALKQLDDDLSDMVVGGIRDIVDTCTWMGDSLQLTGDGILKVVLGSVVKRLDRTRVSQDLRRP